VGLGALCQTLGVIPVIVKDVEGKGMWFMRMPAAPIIGSVITVSVPDIPVHKVVQAVHYECMGAEIGKAEVRSNPNDYPSPYNPNGYPECSVTVYVSDAAWSKELGRWA
jgi:hypothetical protein